MTPQWRMSEQNNQSTRFDVSFEQPGKFGGTIAVSSVNEVPKFYKSCDEQIKGERECIAPKEKVKAEPQTRSITLGSTKLMQPSQKRKSSPLKSNTITL